MTQGIEEGATLVCGDRLTDLYQNRQHMPRRLPLHLQLRQMHQFTAPHRLIERHHPGHVFFLQHLLQSFTQGLHHGAIFVAGRPLRDKPAQLPKEGRHRQQILYLPPQDRVKARGKSVVQVKSQAVPVGMLRDGSNIAAFQSHGRGQQFVQQDGFLLGAVDEGWIILCVGKRCGCHSAARGAFRHFRPAIRLPQIGGVAIAIFLRLPQRQGRRRRQAPGKEFSPRWYQLIGLLQARQETGALLFQYSSWETVVFLVVIWSANVVLGVGIREYAQGERAIVVVVIGYRAGQDAAGGGIAQENRLAVSNRASGSLG